jgi:hypothetical protein
MENQDQSIPNSFTQTVRNPVSGKLETGADEVNNSSGENLPDAGKESDKV